MSAYRMFYLMVIYLTLFYSELKAITPVEIFDKMLHAMQSAKTMTYTLELRERNDGQMVFNNYRVKLQAHPYKLYTYCYTPNAGAEAIYIQGKNHDKVLVNPNSFPYINLNLHAENKLLRKNHQYNILKMGFGYSHSVLNYYYNNNRSMMINCLKLEKEMYWDKKHCYQLVIDFAQFQWIDYTVKPKETIIEIADKKFLNDYMILKYNNLKGYDDVKVGQVIKIPNVFCRKYVMYIDKITLLPLVQMVYDDKGLYSQIEFHNFRLNPVLTDYDFSEKNKEYGF